MIGRHRLSRAEFVTLARGNGSVETVGRLLAVRYSRHLLLLRAVLETAAELAPKESRTAKLEESFAFLARAQERDGAAAARVLSGPHIGAWAAHCLRRLRRGIGGHVPLAIDLAHMGAVATAAAVRAGLDGSALVPVQAGGAFLPTFGRALLPDTEPWRLVLAEVRGDTVVLAGQHTVVPETRDSARWQALRQIRVRCKDTELAVDLDDINPYRDCHRLGAARRLDRREVADWQRLLGEAWRILVTHHPERADPLAAGLDTLVPLRCDDPGRGTSATSRHAFGAMSLTVPTSATSLALALVHEFQHAKLSALLDLTALLEDSDTLHYAGWRDDPRPLGGLLQGTYAFLAVADFWRVQRFHGDEGPPAIAEFEFAAAREKVRAGCATLAGCGALTAAGAAFVAAMADTIDTWRGEHVPDGVARMAGDANADHYLRWRLRNLVLDAAEVETLAEAWQRGAPPPVPLPSGSTRRGGSPDLGNSRLDLAHAVLVDPSLADRLRAAPEQVGTVVPGATAADLALVTGDYAAATRILAGRVHKGDSSTENWAGLGMAARRLEAGALAHRPELVRALYERLDESGGPAPTVQALASWLNPL